jgi:hypothetical protein
MDRMDQMLENGVASGASLLADYSYDTLGRRSNVARANGASTAWSFDGVSGSGAMTLSYDPMGRLLTATSGGIATCYLYDGDRLVAEYTSGALTHRYVHGAGTDEPLVWYKGATLTDRHWRRRAVLRAERQTRWRFVYSPHTHRAIAGQPPQPLSCAFV